eukprot:4595455-Karenia_brevis.AAC.1
MDADVSGGMNAADGIRDGCLIHALNALGFEIQCDEDGPFWILRDGNRFVNPKGYVILPFPKSIIRQQGSFIIYKDNHFTALSHTGHGARYVDNGVGRSLSHQDIQGLEQSDIRVFQVLPWAASWLARGHWVPSWVANLDIQGGMDSAVEEGERARHAAGAMS